jgi:hypothetical protein
LSWSNARSRAASFPAISRRRMWRRKIRGGRLEEEDWRRKIRGGRLEEEDWRRKIGGGRLEEED